ncbi:hypothetical protein D915_001989 [Fasciola hepatica]|uniref:MEIOB-like N-terminal domain-containing protein n=1 Tax=Fasciola hepatica TaxID=6192 RepID=A0A4E0RHG0_FASHE|nr:hypothetical protein D915_001989 [Fasciola hepatica]
MISYEPKLQKLKNTGSDALAIKNITDIQTKFSVIGIIINKLPIRRFIKMIESRRQVHAVLTFTVRDSQFDWINCSYWGSLANVSSVASNYFIGDCVMLSGVRARQKVKGTYEDICMVDSPIGFHLTMNDSSGSIVHLDFPDKTYTAGLKSALIKPSQQHTPLQEIVQRTFSKNEVTALRNNASSYNFFAAVAEIRAPKSLMVSRRIKITDVSSKCDVATVTVLHGLNQMEDKEVIRKCELFVFDETCNRFPVILWNEDWIQLATTTFIPYVTILSFVDCPVKFDQYQRGVVASPNARTVMIVAPECEETNQLSHYIRHSCNRPSGSTQLPCEIQNSAEYLFTQPMPTSYRKLPTELQTVPLSSIHHIVTIQELKTGRDKKGYGIVFALISKIDLDKSDPLQVISVQCNNCQRRMEACDPPGDFNIPAPGKPLFKEFEENFVMCNTTECPIAKQRFLISDTQHAQAEFHILVNLSDHTGTHTRCLLAGNVAQNLLGVTVPQFIAMDIKEKAELKWRLCLHRFKVYFWTEQASFNNPNPLVYIISCEKPSAFEVMTSFKNL